jgi:hypothetical protein
VMNSRRLIAAAEAWTGIVATLACVEEGDVRFGSKADICAAKTHVRFTPNSDRESEIPQNVMSALPPKADMCSALAHVCFGPKADSCTAAKPPRFSGEGGLDHSPMVLGDCRPLIKLTPERHRWDNMFVLQ